MVAYWLRHILNSCISYMFVRMMNRHMVQESTKRQAPKLSAAMSHLQRPAGDANAPFQE